MIVSIAIIVCGISTFFNANNFSVISGMKFGADFYTEIFEEVEQIKFSTRSIDNAIYEVGGMFLISIGSISFCAFLYAISNGKIRNLKEDEKVACAVADEEEASK